MEKHKNSPEPEDNDNRSSGSASVDTISRHTGTSYNNYNYYGGSKSAFENATVKASQKQRTPQILFNLFAQRNKWRKHGELRVCCKETFMFSPVKTWWWMTEIFVLVTTVVFAYKYFFISKVVLVPAIIIAILEWMAFYKTCLKDPGVLPRPPFLVSFRTLITVLATWEPGLRVTKTVLHSNGATEQLTYCWRCHHFRSLATSHCAICDCCMIQHDHHCPVFGGCVAQNNISSFHAMISSMSAFWVYLVGFCIYDMAASTEPQGITDQTSGGAARLTFYVILGEVGLVLLLPTLIDLLKKAFCVKKGNCRRTQDETLLSPPITRGKEAAADVIRYALANNLSIQEIMQLEEILQEDIASDGVTYVVGQDLNHNPFYP